MSTDDESSHDEDSDNDSDSDNDGGKVDLEEIEEEILEDALDTSQFPTMKDVSEEIVDLEESEKSNSDIEMEERVSSSNLQRSSSPTFNLKTETFIELSGGLSF